MVLPVPAALSDLSTIEIEHAGLFRQANEAAEVRSWQYFFPFLHLQRRSNQQLLLFERTGESILIYLLRRRDSGPHLRLLLPPFPFTPAALQHATERMQAFNGDRAVRITRVPEDQVAPVARQGFEISFAKDEYIYSSAAVSAREGSEFSRLRRKLAGLRKYPDLELRPYSPSDAPVCLDLHDNWYANLVAKGITPEGYRYTASCLRNADRFPEAQLRGEVMIVAGAIRGFFFGGPITSRYGSVFITISDNDWPGLSHLQRCRLISSFPDLQFFNDSEDSGRPGLADLKRAFRPVQMYGIFRARREG